MKNTQKTMAKAVLAGVMILTPAWSATTETASAATEAARQHDALAKKVRRELITLPFLSVFDNLAFRIDTDGTVTLSGQVIRPTLRSDSENAVKRLEGVAKVVNNIEVLPLSRFDDTIRIATLRAVYGFPTLQRYGLGANPSIRIIVRNGEVTLEGVVANEGDRNIAFIRANGVSGVFKVTNNLRVDKA